jgi:PhnB protein
VVQNPPKGYPRISPYVLYEDVDGAVDFLTGAFGFTERYRMAGPGARSVHAEVRLGDSVVMVGAPGADYRNPKRLGGATATVYVYVDDIDRHHDTSKAAGAHIVHELADQSYGDRTYAAEDPEGHLWHFAQHIRDVSPEDVQP